MTAALLLILLFLLTIGHLLTLKVCSVKLDHRTAPIFISLWTLLGLLAVAPIFGSLAQEGFVIFAEHPWILGLCILKGALLYLLFIISQELMQESLSSRHYVTPMTVGLIALVNTGLGEHLNPAQWFSAAGLSLLAVGFFFKGHLAGLSPKGRMAYFKLVGLAVLLASFDQLLTKNSNWFSLLLVSNTVLLAMGLALNRANLSLLKAAFFHRAAILAGLFYAATELVKFYQQVTFNPVSMVVLTQAMTKPVILLLSALIWKERTVREQLLWGTAAFSIGMVPLAYSFWAK
jgi:hypothetical protein